MATLQDTKHEGGETVLLRLVDPVGAEPGFVTQAVLNIDDDDPFDPNLLDDFETEPVPFEEEGDLDAGERSRCSRAIRWPLPGQGAARRPAPRRDADPRGRRRGLPARPRRAGVRHGVVTVAILSRARLRRHAPWTTPPSASAAARGDPPRPSRPARAPRGQDVDRDGDLDLVFHFDLDDTGFDCDADRTPLTGRTFAGKRIVHDGYARFGRDFAMAPGLDPGRGAELLVLRHGQRLDLQGPGQGQPRARSGPVGLAPALERRVPRAAPAGRPTRASSPTRSATARPATSPAGATASCSTTPTIPPTPPPTAQGNLVITARAADGSLACYYGPCRYTSARLKTQGKREVGYGRVEARIRLPRGAGLWPAFWSMGTDLGEVGWPQAGEIDIMEWVGRAARRRSSAPSTGPATPAAPASAASTTSAATSRRRRTPSRWSASRARSAGTWTASSTIAPPRPTSRPTRGCSTIRSSCS